jgi:hypothetical protein
MRRCCGDNGMLLVEVLVATGLFVAGFVLVAQLLAVSIETASRSRVRTLAAILASQKIEELLALDWSIDRDGARTSDLSSNLAIDPAGAGGPGLAAATDASLFGAVGGYTDYLDASGGWIGTGSAAPPGSVFVRRWAVLPLAADPADTRVFVVVVTTTAALRAAGVTRAPATRHPDECWLLAVKSRDLR